jgi:multiple sugar transport system permease protein
MKRGAALLMILPVTILFVVTFIAPLIMVGRLSFFRSDYVNTAFVGVQNYIDAFSDTYFLKSFVNSFVMTVMIAPMITIGAYTIASAISDYGKKTQAAARFLFYVPGLASGLIMGLLWAWILDRTGLINNLLAAMNIAAVPWLYDAWPARLSVAIVSTSTGVGGYIILYSVTMHAIPDEMKDAAKIDGASGRQYKRYIQLPLMMPTVMLTLLLSIVGTMQIWETIYVLTAEGGPEGSTASPVYEIFLTAFKFGKAGYAAAKGIILLVVLALIIVIKNRIEKWLE